MTATDHPSPYLFAVLFTVGIKPELFVTLLRLLAEGEPVTVVDLATASGRSEGTVRQGVAGAAHWE